MADRIVVRAPNWLGDAVLALPAMAAVREHFSSSVLTIAAIPSVMGLFREQTDVHPDHLLELPNEGGAVIAALRSGGFDRGILLPNSFRSAWQFWRAGVRERWGFPTASRRALLTRRSRKSRRRQKHHHIDYFRDLVRGLDIPCDDRPPRLIASPLSAERADRLLSEQGLAPGIPLIGVAPGAAYGQAKQWPTDRIGELIARLVAEHDAMCALVGASHDRAAAREIESWLRAHAPEARDRTIDLVGRTSLGVLTGIAARCRVFVTNDSGAMHVAAALGRPVVAIFGPTDERATGPIGSHAIITSPVFCRPCLLRDCPIDHRCMKRISVDQVFAAVVSSLSPPSTPAMQGIAT